MLSLLDGQVPAAENHLALVDPIPDVLPPARAVVALNRAFLAVADKQPVQALAFLKAGEKLAVGNNAPWFNPKIIVLEGLAAWSVDDIVQAEKLFRTAIVARPTSEVPHIYLAQMLAAKTDATGAQAERDTAAAFHLFDQEAPVFAQSIVWVDPINGGIKRH
jgi:hypothetical protein